MNNTYIYSPSTNAFYPLSMQQQYIDNDSWPADAINIPDSIFTEFTGSAPANKIRVAGNEGLPCWSDIPPPTASELIEQAERHKIQLISAANAIISNNNWPSKLALGRISNDEKKLFNTWLDYIDEVNIIDASTSLDIKWPATPE